MSGYGAPKGGGKMPKAGKSSKKSGGGKTQKGGRGMNANCKYS